MSTTTTTPSVQVADVIDAMRDIQTEGDRWNLAERLAVLLPSGSSGFGDIIDAANAEGVAGGLSANTLRLYRDTATRWPTEKRVPNVSFSAHREAMVLPTITEAGKMLRDIEKSVGAGNVTVASVRKAVAVKQGKAPKAPKAGTASKSFDVLADIKGGASALIAAIDNGTDADALDKLHGGLTKAIAHVERLRAKAAQKAAAAKAAP